MAILETVLSQTYQGQQVINRWYYVSSGTPASVSLSFALISAMGLLEAAGNPALFPAGTIGAALQGMQSSAVTYVSAAARDLYSDTDFYESPYPAGVGGQVGGVAASPALAYGLTTNRIRQSVRRGAKRVTGVTEDGMIAGGGIEAGYLTQLNTLATRMSATLTYDDEGNTLTFVPAVLAFEPYTTPSGRTAYRKYATEAAQLQRTAQGVLWSPLTTVRTQVSRQYGRGN